MKRIITGIMVCGIVFSCFAKSWRKESLTEDVGFSQFNHIVVYNDSDTKFEANYVTVDAVSKIEFEDTVINLSGLRNHGLRIYYDYFPAEKKIVVHVAEDRGIRE